MREFFTVSTTKARNVKLGNDATTAFPIDFVFIDDADLRVTLVVTATGVETLQTLTTHYTVSGGGTPAATGTVTMITPPATGEELVIERVRPFTQLDDLERNSPLPAEVLELAYDKAVMLVQQNLDVLNRSIRLPITDDPDNPSGNVVPAPENNKTLVGKSDLSGWENKTIQELSGVPLATPVSILQGGTNATTAAAARTNLSAQEDVITTRGDLVRGSSAAVAERLALTKFRHLSSNANDVLWVGGVGAATAGTITVTEADHMKLLRSDANVADRAVNLPTGAPSIDGMIVGVEMTAGGSAVRVDNPTVNETQIDAGPGVTINGLDQQFDLLVQGHRVWLQYVHADTDWVLLSERLPVPVQYIYTSTATWTRPKGKRWAKSTTVGPGGSGAVDTTAGVTGGASGGAVISTDDVSGATTQSVTVGTGGAAILTTGNGNPGSGASSFGAFSSAGAGGGGNQSGNIRPAGGTATTGDINIPGQTSGSIDNVVDVGSNGGNTPLGLGSGGAGDRAAANAGAGQGFGAGGGGCSSSSGGDSGAGADGAVIIEVF